MEFKKISDYDIHIRHTINGGVIVKVGCAELSFSSPEDMMDIMKQYYADPKGMEKEYNSNVGLQEVETSHNVNEERQPESRAIGHGGSATGRALRGPNTEARAESPLADR